MRCGFCLTYVRDVAPAAAEPAVEDSGRRWPLPRRLTLRGGILLALLAVGGWWLASAWLTEPSPLPLPASTALDPLTGPDQWAAHGDHTHARRTTARAVLNGSPAWTIELGAAIVLPPVADSARLYVVDENYRIVALDAGTGIEVWTYSAPVPLWSAPSVAGDMVYLTLRRGDVVALDAQTGMERWTTATRLQVFAAPVIAAGLILVQGGGALAGLDATSGEELWRLPLPDDLGLVGPVVLGETIAVPVRAEILLLDRQTGEQRFAFPQSGSTALLAAGTEIVAVNQNFAAGIDPASHSPWWEGVRGAWNQLWLWGVTGPPPRPEANWATSVRTTEIPSHIAAARTLAPALDDARLYTADREGLVRAFTLGTGELAWELRLPDLAGPPLLTGDGLLLTSAAGLSLHDPATGAALATFPLPGDEQRWTAVTTRATYLVEGDGRVRALRSGPSETSDEPD